MLKHKCRLSAYFRQIGFYLIISNKSAELFFICNYTIWGEKRRERIKKCRWGLGACTSRSCQVVFLSYIAFLDLINKYQHYKRLRICSFQGVDHIRGIVYSWVQVKFFLFQRVTKHNWMFTLYLGKIYYRMHIFLEFCSSLPCLNNDKSGPCFSELTVEISSLFSLVSYHPATDWGWLHPFWDFLPLKSGKITMWKRKLSLNSYHKILCNFLPPPEPA